MNLNTFFTSINGIDVLFIFLVLYFAITNSGFIVAILDILGLFFSFLVSLRMYGYIAQLFIQYGSMQKGFANVLGLVVSWIIAETLFFLIVRLITKKIPPQIFDNRLNYILGFIPGALYGILFFTFIVSLLIALPVRGNLKQEVLSSKTGPIFVRYSTIFESSYKNIFNDAIADSLNFVTIKENSEGSVDLGFTVKSDQLVVDNESENLMFNDVNHERTSRGLHTLKLNDKLTKAARVYAEVMFVNGFFAHESKIDNTSPADRLDKQNIPYMIMGENLAYAPTEQIAHTGLMNSPGHRANILSTDFGEVGIGVIDAGVYGKMFVQEFTN